MNFFYLITSFFLLITFLLIRKKDDKLNIITWLTLSFVLYLCYNMIIAYILNLFNLKCTLLNFSVINFVIASFFWFYILKNKKIQNYYLKIKDLIFTIFLFVVVACIGYKQYGIPFNIKYDTTDPATHYMATNQFYEYSKLLNKVDNTTLYEFTTFMIGSYVNVGMLFKAFAEIIGENNLYYIFILFDLFILFIQGMMFYSLFSDKTKKKLDIILVYLFTLIYVCAYPLNSLIFGYEYLGIGILIISSIIYVVEKFNKDNYNWYLVLILGLLNFGLFFSYYLFIPVVYAAEGIYFLILYKRNKWIISKESFKVITVSLFIPFCIGICYFFLPGFFDVSISKQGALKEEGYIYRDLYSNFIFFIPFIIYYFIFSFKRKNINFETILTIFLICFIFLLFLGGMKGKVSSYYYYKNYFLLWLLSVFIFIKCLIEIKNSDCYIIYSFSILYIAVIIFSISGIDSKIANRNKLFNVKESLSSYTEIFCFNFNKIRTNNPIYTDEQLQLIKQVKKNNNIDNEQKIPIVGDLLQQLWFYSFNKKNTTKSALAQFYDKEPIVLEDWENKKYKTLIYFNDNKYFIENKEEILKDTVVIFENEAGAIISKE